LKAYQADIAKFEATDSQVIGISVDSPFANQRFAEDIGVRFPLLSDMTRKVTKEYGLLNEEWSVARRATFVLDKTGKIVHIEEGNSAVDPTGAMMICSRLKK